MAFFPHQKVELAPSVMSRIYVRSYTSGSESAEKGPDLTGCAKKLVLTQVKCAFDIKYRVDNTVPIRSDILLKFFNKNLPEL
jgi:hypothetical protein